MGETKNQESMLADQARELYRLNNVLAEKDREIERLIEQATTWNQAYLQLAKVIDPHDEKPSLEAARDLMDSLCASQAREREAVERAEHNQIKADHYKALLEIKAEDLRDKESALAAARKALEELLGWFTTPCHPGEPAMKAVVPVRELARFRAALNGDSHAEG